MTEVVDGPMSVQFREELNNAGYEEIPFRSSDSKTTNRLTIGQYLENPVLASVNIPGSSIVLQMGVFFVSTDEDQDDIRTRLEREGVSEDVCKKVLKRYQPGKILVSLANVHDRNEVIVAIPAKDLVKRFSPVLKILLSGDGTIRKYHQRRNGYLEGLEA